MPPPTVVRFTLKRSRLLPWNRRYVLKSYISGSMWLVPLFALLVYAAFHRVVHAVGAWMVERGWTSDATSFQGLPLAGARSLLETLIALSLSFTVFTFSSLLVAIQVAGGQYTPRIIATALLRNNVIRYTVGIFVFTFVFEIKSLSLIEKSVPQLVLFAGGLLGFICIVAFLFLIDYAAKLLRPISLVRYVGEQGLRVLSGVYPVLLTDGAEKDPADGSLPAQRRTVARRGSSGIVVAV